MTTPGALTATQRGGPVEHHAECAKCAAEGAAVAEVSTVHHPGSGETYAAPVRGRGGGYVRILEAAGPLYIPHSGFMYTPDELEQLIANAGPDAAHDGGWLNAELDAAGRAPTIAGGSGEDERERLTTRERRENRAERAP